jgi:hypothetical protein
MITILPQVGLYAFRSSDENADEPQWVPIRNFQDITLAHLCVSYLESEGIRAIISNERHIQMFPGFERVVVYVPAAHKGRALDLLTDFELKRNEQSLIQDRNDTGKFKQRWLWWIILAVIIALLLFQLFMEKYNGQLTW